MPCYTAETSAKSSRYHFGCPHRKGLLVVDEQLMKGREKVPTTAGLREEPQLLCLVTVPLVTATSSHGAGGGGMAPLGIDEETCLSFSTGEERGKYLCEKKEGIT